MILRLRYVTGSVLACAAIFCLTGVSTGADELLSRAAAQFRERDYVDAATLAQKAGASPQRSFLLGIADLRQDKAAEALPLLAEAQQRLPLVGDYAALYQAEALLKLKRYGEAAAKAAAIPKSYPSSLLMRRSQKLYADIFFESGDFKGALKVCQAFVEKYPSGSDSVEVLFKVGRCREETGDKAGAAQVYRSIWLNNPAAPQADKAQELLQGLETAGVRLAPCTPEELLRRASTLSSRNRKSLALQTLQSIPLDGQSPAFIAKVDLRTGMVQYRLRNYKLAEKCLTRASGCSVTGIRSEARFWLAKTLERDDQKDQAFSLYMALAGEGKKQEFSDDALVAAAGLRRGLSAYQDAARLYDQVPQISTDAKFLAYAAWESAWCRYLAGDYAGAADGFKGLLKDGTVREKALYWLGRALENKANGDGAAYFKLLQDEYPAGFYATWYREQHGIKDTREPLGPRNALAELPLLPGLEKPRLLASLGMLTEARSELVAALRKMADRKTSSPGLTRLYLEMHDYSAAIAQFQQTPAPKWENTALPLWTGGYPLAYRDQITQYAAANDLSDALVFALIRAESSFSNYIKSPAGAVGLMQLMPDTARAVIKEKGTFDPLRLIDPELNIRLGTKHFHDLLKGYDGDVVYAIAAYNAGSGAVGRWRKKLKGLKKDEFIENIPYGETREYVKKVYASAVTYRQLYGLR